jgi:hypothetical protein
MRTFYVFVSRDILINKKRILTYKKIEEPGLLSSFLGKRTRSKHVRFIGIGHDWVTYPEGKKCSRAEVEMLYIEDGRQSAKYGDLDVRVF